MSSVSLQAVWGGRLLVGVFFLASLVNAGCDQVSNPGGVSLPAADTPLDAAWRELIQIQERQFQKLAGVHNASQAEEVFRSAMDYQRERNAALKKIADLGGSAPPSGVPEKYREQYKAVEDRLYARDHVVAEMLTPERRQELNQQLEEAMAADASLATDPFRVTAAKKAAATPGAATVTLVNNKSVAGPAHQQMIARLQQLAGASSAQSVIDPDGSYKVVLAPVTDFAGFVAKIDLGDVSNRDDASKSLTLTIDPAKVNAHAPAAPAPGQPPFAGPGRHDQPPFGGPRRGPAGGPAGGPAAQMEQRKNDFLSKMGGAENCATLILNGAPASGTSEYNELLAKIKSETGATSTMGLSLNGRRQLLVAPVASDLDTLAAKITFGTVTAKNPEARELTVDVTAP